jgi:hypothetical protein
MVQRNSDRLSEEEMEQLKQLSRTFPADLGLGLSSVAEKAAPTGPPPDIADQQQQESGMGSCTVVDGQRFYNFDQLVEALGCGPDVRCVCVCVCVCVCTSLWWWN